MSGWMMFRGPGFRQFFPLATVFAAIAMVPWLALLAGWDLDFGSDEIPSAMRHGHEMLFGYVPAVIAGFLLTAVPNWTGTQPLDGRPLLLLVVLWLAGRASIWFGGDWPFLLVMLVDILFLPALLVAVATPLIRAKARRQMVIAIPILGLAAANLMTHLDFGGWFEGLAGPGFLLGADLILFLIAVIGGRIVPAFTGNALKAAGETRLPTTPGWLDKSSLALLAAAIIAEFAAPETLLSGSIIAVAAIAHAARMAGWRTHRTLSSPILWVLHLGYAWVVIALALKAAAHLGLGVEISVALHAITVGAVGTMTIAVMTRATLGHSGRPIVAGPSLTTAYILITLAALFRVAGPAVMPDSSVLTLQFAAASWTLAYLIVAIVFWMILSTKLIKTHDKS